MKKLVICAVIFLTACATDNANKRVQQLQAEANPGGPGSESPLQPQFDRGVQALDAERYADAAAIFDALLVKKPATDLDLVTIFNSGVAYENLGQCQKASERYRQVVRASATKFKRIEGEALFRLSMAYECMGQDAKTVTALLDAKRRGKDLSFEVVNAEIPARMAAAYARLGNREKALEYFNQASQGLKATVSRSSGRVQKDLLARTLYLMGKLSPTQRSAGVEPTTYLQSLSMQQPYLLQAMEFNKAPWSGKAEEDLKAAYRNIWDFNIADPEQKREFYTRGLQTINELRKIRLNKPDSGIDSVFVMLDDTENKLQNQLTKLGPTNKLTSAAEKREGLKQNGRLVDPNANAKAKKTKKQ